MPAHEPTGQPRRQDTTLRVATMNILSPSHANWPVRRPLLKECLSRLEADVYALQEIDVTAYDAAGELIGPGYHIVRHSRSAPDGTGALVASRWPLVVLRELDLDVSPRTSTDSWYSSLIAEVHAQASWGNFLMVHHKPVWQHGYERERELQAVVTAREVERLLNDTHRHVILAGDFDAAPDSSSIRFWTGLQSLEGVSVAYQDSWAAKHPDGPGHTFSPHNALVRHGDMPLDPGRRIDYIMNRCGVYGPSLAVAECRRIADKPDRAGQPSDHYGLCTDYQLPRRPVGTPPV